jgi:hypothetical protein
LCYNYRRMKFEIQIWVLAMYEIRVNIMPGICIHTNLVFVDKYISVHTYYIKSYCYRWC